MPDAEAARPRAGRRQARGAGASAALRAAGEQRCGGLLAPDGGADGGALLSGRDPGRPSSLPAHPARGRRAGRGPGSQPAFSPPPPSPPGDAGGDPGPRPRRPILPRPPPVHGLISARRAHGALYSGELEVQAKRKAIAVLQDEIHRILNASREMATLPDLMIKRDKAGIKACLEQISSIEDDVENLRRKITREVADVGGLIINRENLLNAAYTMDEIAGYITGISFKLSNVKPATLRSSKLDKDLTVLAELVVDEVYKLNEVIRSLSSNSASAIDLAQETQAIEREIDTKYRLATMKLLAEVSNTRELMLIKDVIEGIEEMADKCQRVSDSFILLALSL